MKHSELLTLNSVAFEQTFVACSLLPQYLGDVCGPHLLDVCGGGLEDVRMILCCSSAKPDLETQRVLARSLCQANVSRLQHTERKRKTFHTNLST